MIEYSDHGFHEMPSIFEAGGLHMGNEDHPALLDHRE